MGLGVGNDSKPEFLHLVFVCDEEVEKRDNASENEDFSNTDRDSL